MRSDLIVLNIIFSPDKLVQVVTQYTCYKTLKWLRVSLTCCTYVLGGTMIFSFDKSTSLGEGVRKTPKIIRGGGGGSKNERKK